MQGTRRPGRHKRGTAGQDRWPGGIWIGARYLPPIAGAEDATVPPTTDEKPKQDADSEGNGTPGDTPKPGTEARFSQADVDRIVTERLAREKASADKAAEKARREAEEQAAAQQGEYQKLAEQRQQRIAALEAQVAEGESHKARADKYEAALQTQLAAQRKDLPKHILELLDDKDPADQLTWLAKNAEHLGAAAARPGVPATPRANGATAADRVTENRQKLAATGAYSRF